MFFVPSWQVLRNQDLLHVIFGFCEYHEPRDLLWASLTCKTFLEPALDVLWRDVDDVLQLCYPLPMFNTETHEFTALVLDQDLERVLYYAHRIRFLTVDMMLINEFPNINLDVLFSFFNRIDKASAFRSLRSFKIWDDLKSTYQHQLHLFSLSAQNLENLELYVSALPEISTASFLYTISSESQNIKSFTIVSTVTKTICDVVPWFRKLEYLDIRGMDCDDPIGFFNNCASSLTSLQSLSVRLDSFGFINSSGQLVPHTTASRTLDVIHFDLLTNLELSGDFDDVGSMLNILLVPKLVTLSLEVDFYDDNILSEVGPIVQGFLTSNEQHLKNGLRSLTLQSNAIDLSVEGYLSPFKSCSQLDSLHVKSYTGFHIPTSSLANFLRDNKVWMNLTKLSFHLGHPDSEQFEDMLSIAALPLLADAFPKLLRLTITIHNPDQTAMATILANGTRKPHNLETLSFFSHLPRGWVYSTSSAIIFSSFLHQLFPKLKKVECFDCPDWIKTVQDMLKQEQNT